MRAINYRHSLSLVKTKIHYFDMQGLNKNILSCHAGFEQKNYLDVKGLNKIILTTLHLCQKLSADTATPQ